MGIRFRNTRLFPIVLEKSKDWFRRQISSQVQMKSHFNLNLQVGVKFLCERGQGRGRWEGKGRGRANDVWSVMGSCVWVLVGEQDRGEVGGLK